MRRRASCLFLVLALVFCGAGGAAAETAGEALPDPAAEARAQALGSALRCVVCQSESINDSQADMARDLRLLVREQIAKGWSDQQILDFARARYGDFILLRPPVQANTYVLWGLPILILGGAGGLIFWHYHRYWRSSRPFLPHSAHK